MHYTASGPQEIQHELPRNCNSGSLRDQRCHQQHVQGFSWETGDCWTYHLAVNIQDTFNKMIDRTHWIHYPMQQAIEYAGLSMFRLSSAQARANSRCWSIARHITLSVNNDLAEDCIRGSSTFPSRMIETNSQPDCEEPRLRCKRLRSLPTRLLMQRWKQQ